MTYLVEFSDAAKSEVDAAYLCLLRRSPEAAGRWLDGLDAALSSLAESLAALHGRRPLVPEDDIFPDIDLFQLIYGKGSVAYRVLYYPVDANGDGDSDTVRVLHVRHGAQRQIGSQGTDED